MKQIIPRVILLCWECPECGRDTDLEAGVIWSYYGHKEIGQPLIQECEWCGHKAEMNLDDIDI